MQNNDLEQVNESNVDQVASKFGIDYDLTLKYGDKIIYMEGIIRAVHDGAVCIDLKGRLGYLEIPKRMIISDYELKVGQTIGFNMSFIEQLGEEVDQKYVENFEREKNKTIKKV